MSDGGQPAVVNRLLLSNSNSDSASTSSSYPYAYLTTNTCSLDFTDLKNREKVVVHELAEEELGTLKASGSSSSMGWRDVPFGAPSVASLKETLMAETNGINGLESVDHEDVQRAAKLFYRDGFVVVADVVPEDILNELKEACMSLVRSMVRCDAHRKGNRGSHRYSFSEAFESGSCLHLRPWARLVDMPRLTPVLQHIFDSPDYRLAGAGGDFVLPGAIGYQPLHTDLNDRVAYKSSEGGAEVHGAFRDPRGILTVRDLPCPFLSCNVVLENIDRLDGPMRHIPGTQHSREATPSLSDEPAWMRFSTLCPLRAASVIIRDVRAWHGGTPNLSDNTVRILPNVEFFAPWYRERIARPLMPLEVWRSDALSDYARELSRDVVEVAGEIEVDVRFSDTVAY